MTGDRTTTDSKADKAQPAGASRTGPSTEELSRQLAERLARQRAADPAAAAAARRAALLAYDQARERRLIVALSVVLAATVAASVGYFVSTIDSRPVLPLASAAASPQPAPPVETAAAVPAPAALEFCAVRIAGARGKCRRHARRRARDGRDGTGGRQSSGPGQRNAEPCSAAA